MIGSEEVAVGDTLIFKNIAFFRNCLLCLSLGVFDWEIGWVFCCDCLSDRFYDWLDGFSCLFVMVCFERIIDWVLRGLFFLIVWFDWLFRLVVFLLNDCDFVRKKKNKGLTVHCIVAVVKPYVKMSAVWFKRLIFWFGCVLFVVKTFSCSGRRFASDTS